uniref:Serine/threonine/tyrosine interacting like 1 n=1 Tax=Podarcis muralis TaxID=64176 RepID=A0A670JVX4_PODMU
MAGVALCEPTELYNMLNQSTKISRLAEPNYLCLMGKLCSFVLTDYVFYFFPPSVNLECVRYCVVYDGKSTSVDAAYDIDYDLYEVDKELTLGSAPRCARIMQRFTSYPVLVLRGGYELFTATYHYLRTQKIFWMPQELEAFKPYPVEILPARLYMGNYAQACDSQIQKDLKIKAHLNVCEEAGTFFLEDSDRLLHIPIPDSPDADMFSYFPKICHFIGEVGTTHLSDAQLIAGLSHSLCQNPLCSVSQEPRTQLIIGHSESRSQRSFASPMLSAESPVCLSSPWGAWSRSSSSCVSTSHPPSHAHMISGCRAGVGFFFFFGGGGGTAFQAKLRPMPS